MFDLYQIYETSDNMWLKGSLQEHPEARHVELWAGLCNILRSFMWISPLHDKPGQHIFDSALLLGSVGEQDAR